MQNNIRSVHTNLVAKDWKSLSEFYINVFSCKPIYSERDLSGEWLEKLTGIKEVRIRGIHLSLPGYENGPTLEIFEYSPAILRNGGPAINMQGLGHIAFLVDDVEEVLKKFIENGGKLLGEIVRKEIPKLGLLTVAYTSDPEGNFIELQNWQR